MNALAKNSLPLAVRIIRTAFWVFAIITGGAIGLQLVIDIFDIPELAQSNVAPKPHMRIDHQMAFITSMYSAVALGIATIAIDQKGVRKYGIIILLCCLVSWSWPRF